MGSSHWQWMGPWQTRANTATNQSTKDTASNCLVSAKDDKTAKNTKTYKICHTKAYEASQDTKANQHCDYEATKDAKTNRLATTKDTATNQECDTKANKRTKDAKANTRSFTTTNTWRHEDTATHI